MGLIDHTTGVRVILVGRTGLDATLRRDAHFELVRVGAAYEAIGELATPIDEESPTQSVVILAGDAQAWLGSAEDGGGRERFVDFLRALRMVDPGVRVCGIVGQDTSEAKGLLDASIDGSSASEGVRSLLSVPTEGRVQGTESSRVSVPVSAESEQSLPQPPEGAMTDFGPRAAVLDLGDGPIVECMLQGRDILPVALEQIRGRCGDPTVEFVAAEPSAPQALGVVGVPVSYQAVVYGRLLASGSDASELLAHASWLASWLRLRDQQMQLRQAAFMDPLTGAWNRRYFERYLATAIEAAREQRWNVTVLMFDIDDFKRYNDQYSHEAGDEILVETVRLMQSVIRPSDRVCRIGGDEFAVVFYDPRGPRSPESKHPKTVFDIAQRFQSQINAHRFPKLGGSAPGTLTVSGGLATYPWDGASATELLRKADERSMQSKRLGKNAIVFGATGGDAISGDGRTLRP